jgi:hypothetical protein
MPTHEVVLRSGECGLAASTSAGTEPCNAATGKPSATIAGVHARPVHHLQQVAAGGCEAEGQRAARNREGLHEHRALWESRPAAASPGRFVRGSGQILRRRPSLRPTAHHPRREHRSGGGPTPCQGDGSRALHEEDGDGERRQRRVETPEPVDYLCAPSRLRLLAEHRRRWAY